MQRLVPGDKVEFINEKLKGEVTDLIDNKQVMIMLENGLEIPVNVNELIKSDDVDTSEIKSAEQKKFVELENMKEGVFLVFTFENDLICKNIYLINNSEYELFFTISKCKPKKNQGIGHGHMHISSYKSILESDSIEPDKLYIVELLFFNPNQKLYKPPVSHFFRVPSKVNKSELISIPLIHKNGILEQLDKSKHLTIDYIKSMEQTKNLDKDQTSSDIVFNIEVPLTEIDLHIESIREDFKLLEPYEILKIQIDYFKQSLTKAVALNHEKIIFIHGVGQGILKEQLLKLLKNHPYVKRFHDASYKKFGHGATEVVLK